MDVDCQNAFAPLPLVDSKDWSFKASTWQAGGTGVGVGVGVAEGMGVGGTTVGVGTIVGEGLGRGVGLGDGSGIGCNSTAPISDPSPPATLGTADWSYRLTKPL